MADKLSTYQAKRDFTQTESPRVPRRPGVRTPSLRDPEA